MVKPSGGRGIKRGTIKKVTFRDGQQVAFQHSGKVEVSVTDTGAGMSPDQLTKLFRDGVQFNVNQLQAGKGS
jgi:signal transduction histidine kinase